MKIKDLIAGVLFVVVFFLLIFVMDIPMGNGKTFNQEHGLIMSFFKFAILATCGECLGLRISQGVYNRKGFGVLPRALVWGLLGLGMYCAFKIFPTGVLALLVDLGMTDAITSFTSSAITCERVFIAFSISVVMNVVFGPVFMTLHKITDTHIVENQGTLRGFFRPIAMGRILANLNWNVQWGFVFKKTIPLFWFPAHTISFLLPGEYRVLFAALLGVVLGVILSIANLRKA